MNFRVIYRLIFVSFLFFGSLFAEAEKVLVLTYCCNRPDFIEWQYKTFEKFLLDDYEFVVFNDARNPEVSSQIESMCNKYDITCVRVPQNHPNNTPGGRHQDSIQYSLDLRGFKHAGIVCMIDSDMFLVKYFSIVNFMKNYDIAAWPQLRPNNVRYLFPGLVFMNMNTLPEKTTINWAGGVVNGSVVDTGGQMHYYLKNNSSLRLLEFDSLIYDSRATVFEINNWMAMCANTVWVGVYENCYLIFNGFFNVKKIYVQNLKLLQEYGFDDCALRLFNFDFPGSFQFLLNCTFFHYRAASWDYSIDHSKKTLFFNQYISEILS